jgi:hypothetical protein
MARLETWSARRSIEAQVSLIQQPADPVTAVEPG